VQTRAFVVASGLQLGCAFISLRFLG